MGGGYRILLLLATHPLGEDFTRDGIPDLVRAQDNALSDESSEQLEQTYSLPAIRLLNK